MRIRAVQTCALGGAVTVLVTAGCSGAPSIAGSGAPSPTTQAASVARAGRLASISAALPTMQRLPHARHIGAPAQRSARPDLTGKFIYTAQFFGNDTSVYTQTTGARPAGHHTPSLTFLETLTGFSGPQGIVATPKGSWYVANTDASNVLVFQSTASGPIGPTKTLDDSGQYPVDVDTTANEKLVAVSNIFDTGSSTGSISLYKNGATTPTGTLGVADTVQGIGIAIDKAGNCYWSYNDLVDGTGYIVLFAKCKGTATTVVSGIEFAGGLAFDKAGNLYYTDQDVGLYKCVGASNDCSLLTSGFGDPLFINFDSGWKDLWVADVSGFIDAVNPTTGVVEYSTPAVGGSSDPPLGIAAAPGAKY